MQAGDFDEFDAEGGDDRAGILVHDLTAGPGELNAVAVHDEADGGAVQVGAVEAVEGLPGDPSGVAAVADGHGFFAVVGFGGEGLSHRQGNHDAEATAVHGSAARQPGDVAGDVHSPAEFVHHHFAFNKAQGGQRGVVADGGVRVFDGKVFGPVVHDSQGHEKGGDQLQTAAEVVKFVDFRQGGEGTQGGGGGFLFQAVQRGDFFVGQFVGGQVYPEGQYFGRHLVLEIVGMVQQGPVTRFLGGLGE